MKIKPGIIKRIHVDQRIIRSNVKNHEQAPPLTVQLSTGSIKASRVRINGKSELVYSPEKPLSCGARLWIETKAGVETFA